MFVFAFLSYQLFYMRSIPPLYVHLSLLVLRFFYPCPSSMLESFPMHLYLSSCCACACLIKYLLHASCCSFCLAMAGSASERVARCRAKAQKRRPALQNALPAYPVAPSFGFSSEPAFASSSGHSCEPDLFGPSSQPYLVRFGQPCHQTPFPPTKTSELVPHSNDPLNYPRASTTILY